MKKLLFIFLSTFFLIIIVELFFRTFILVVSKEIDVFKYGIDKNVKIDVKYLTKLEIDIINLNPRLGPLIQNQDKKTNNPSRILVIGGSTSYGKNCSNKTSYIDFLQKNFQNIYFENAAGNGYSSEVSLRWIIKKFQNNQNYKAVIWANKVNENRVIYRGINYRNYNKMKYKFINSPKSDFIIFLKSIDKTLETKLSFYLIFKNTLLKLNNRRTKDRFFTKPPSQDDFKNAALNYRLNTIDAINISNNLNIEFIILHLLDNPSKRYDLLNNLLKKEVIFIKKKFPNIKYVDLNKHRESIKDEYFCDEIHQTDDGNKFTAKILYEELQKLDQNIFN